MTIFIRHWRSGVWIFAPLSMIHSWFRYDATVGSGLLHSRFHMCDNTCDNILVCDKIVMSLVTSCVTSWVTLYVTTCDTIIMWPNVWHHPISFPQSSSHTTFYENWRKTVDFRKWCHFWFNHYTGMTSFPFKITNIMFALNFLPYEPNCKVIGWKLPNFIVFEWKL